MSDYELADLFLAQTSAVMTYFMNFISVTSALLAVGYFAGKSLPSGLARAVVWIYAISSVVIITGTNRNLANVAAIRDQMGSGLKWHKALRRPCLVYARHDMGNYSVDGRHFSRCSLVFFLCAYTWRYEHLTSGST